VGTDWPRKLDDLRKLERFANDAKFQDQWREVKLANKRDFAAYLKRRLSLEVRADSLFDVQVKRLHEYKRQHLNVLHAIALYHRLKQGREQHPVPRTVIFGGKAAPAYYMAKLIIRLIHGVAEVVNHDERTRDWLKVVFVPDYNVQTAERIFPAADLSEQISLAGKEASGTGNMKFTMNGALTIGTLDGANVEIREEVGAENFFLFGLDASEAQTLRSQGYSARSYYESDPELRECLDSIADGCFSRGNRDLFRPLVDSLLHRDEYMALADFRSYVDCQKRVEETYANPALWTRMAILNVARSGKFSSDRAILEYCRDIWHVEPVRIEPVPLGPQPTAQNFLKPASK
jgi:starch phosphorylase